MSYGGPMTAIRPNNILPAISNYELLTPSVDSGWAQYLNGERQFLPASSNYFINPRLNYATGGLAYGLTCAPANTTVTTEIVTRVINGITVNAQRIRIVGGAGVASSASFLDTNITDAGTFVQNDYFTESMYLKIIELTGCSIRPVVVSRNAAQAQLGLLYGRPLSSVTADFVQHMFTTQITDANGSRCQFKFVPNGDFHNGDVIEIEFAMMMHTKAMAPTDYYDGSYAGCAWSGIADKSISTRTASALSYTDLVSVDSNGPAALAGQTIYKRNLDATYFGPVVITPSAKSDAVAAEIARSYGNLRRLWNCLFANDVLITFDSAPHAYKKLGAATSSPADLGFESARNWVRKGALSGLQSECSVQWNGTIWQMWSASAGMLGYATAPALLGPWSMGTSTTLSGGGASAARAQVRIIGGTYHLLVTSGTGATQIDHFTSPDGTPGSWTLSATAVLSVGVHPAWDDVWFGNTEFWEEDGTYYMLYEGGGASAVMKLGLATAASMDGPWTKYASNPVLGTEAMEAGSPCVIKKASTYYCWFLGGYATQLPTEILLSTSTDLHTWTTPTMDFPRATTDEGVGQPRGQVADPEIVEYENVLYMYYTGAVDGQGVGPWVGKLAAGYLT